MNQPQRPEPKRPEPPAVEVLRDALWGWAGAHWSDSECPLCGHGANAEQDLTYHGDDCPLRMAATAVSEAEAALLARPRTPEPLKALMDHHVSQDCHPGSEFPPLCVAAQRAAGDAARALLARRAPGDRGNLPLIEAAELVLAARDSVGLEAMPVDLWAAIDTLRFGLKAVGHPWTGALRADSRPEHGVPHTVYLKPGEQAAVIRAPRRADSIVFDFEEESAPVRPEEPPE